MVGVVYTTVDLREHAIDLVDMARMSPSLHNAQPWQFGVTSRAIEVYVDRAQALRVLDPAERQMLIGVGAALFVMRLGVAMLGAEPEVSLLPRGETDELAAVVSAGPDHVPTLEEVRLMDQVPRRRTIRERMSPEIPGRARAALSGRAADESATMWWIWDSMRRRALAHLVSVAESREEMDPRIQAELALWVGGRRARFGFGIPEEALGPTPDSGKEVMFPSRDYAGGRPRLAPALGGREEEPTVAILTTPSDDRLDWLRAGQALMRVLLTATAEGLGASYFNQPLELPDLRVRMRDDLALPGFPQLVLRFGRPVGRWPVPTPRRPVEELLRP